MEYKFMAKYAKMDKSAKLPTRKTPTDAGMDLYALEYSEIPDGGIGIVRTGVTVEVPDGFFVWIANKSSRNYLVGGGIVDGGYQGELLVKVMNTSGDVLRIPVGTAIAQMIVLPFFKFEFVEVPLESIHKTRTARGSSGGIVTQLENPS